MRRGSQQPTAEHLPARDDLAGTTGPEAVELAATAGLDLFPWQQHVLEHGLRERTDGRWAAFEVGLVVPRQNGKGAIFEARQLASLLLLPERLIVHSAHRYDTAKAHFERMLELVETSPDIDRRVQAVRHANDDRHIRMKDGTKLSFRTRVTSGSRGLQGDVVFLDEALKLPAEIMRAIVPTMTTRPNPQLWYGSTAVNQNEHPHGVTLSAVRDRAMAGDDPKLAWFEWSASYERWEQADAEGQEQMLGDVDEWAAANPSLGYLFDVEYIADEKRTFAADPRGWAVERLGLGDWPKVKVDGDAKIDADVWRWAGDGRSTVPDREPVAIAVEVSSDRRHASIGLAGRRADGRWHVEVTDHGPGTRWVVGRVTELRDRWRPLVIVVDGKSPAASLIPELEQAGVTVGSAGPSELDPLWVTSASEMAAACGGFYDAATNDELRHRDQQLLNQALLASTTRNLAGGWAWARVEGSDTTPLVAVTLALHGFAKFAHQPGETVLDGALMS